MDLYPNEALINQRNWYLNWIQRGLLHLVWEHIEPSTNPKLFFADKASYDHSSTPRGIIVSIQWLTDRRQTRIARVMKEIYRDWEDHQWKTCLMNQKDQRLMEDIGEVIASRKFQSITKIKSAEINLNHKPATTKQNRARIKSAMAVLVFSLWYHVIMRKTKTGRKILRRTSSLVLYSTNWEMNTEECIYINTWSNT